MYIREELDKIQKGYSDKDVSDLLGLRSNFRGLVEKLVKNVVLQGKWFSFCTRVSEEQCDIMSLKNDSGQKLGSILATFYEETPYRSAVYKYLLKGYLCYYEVPTVKAYGENRGAGTYNKYLITSNMNVIAKWLGISFEEAVSTYRYQLYGITEDNECNMFPYVKLYRTKDGINKITKPKKELDLSLAGTRVIPLFALKAGVDVLYQLLSRDFYSVTFLKDGGQVREINTTFDAAKLRDIYGDDSFWSDGVSAMYDGDFMDNPNLERGYIRIFEAGASRYDSALRSINYARILSFRKEEPSLAFVNVDLDNAPKEFLKGVYNHPMEIPEIVDMLEVFNVGTGLNTSGSVPRRLMYAEDFDHWVDAQKLLLSTIFLRQLALFMLGNPQWFNNYTGGRCEKEPVVGSDSDEIMDIDDFDFDFYCKGEVIWQLRKKI